MKRIISIICLVLVLCLSLGTLTACHSKDETAVTVNGHKIRTATYMCALLQADNEARTKVYEELSKAEDFDSSKEIDYWSQTVDGKDYETWVRDRALALCKTYVATLQKCEELGVKLTDEQVSNTEYYASYNWSNNGYSYLYQPNGVSFETYLDYYKNSALSSAYFLSIYGKDGAKALSDDEINKAISENFDLMNYLASAFTTDDGEIKDEDTIAAEKAKLESYADKINNGIMTFAEASKDWNGEKEDAATGDNEVTDTDEGEEKEKPLDETAILIATADSDSSYASDYFDKVHTLEIGKATVISEDDRNVLLVRGNLTGDPYYMKNLYNDAVSLLKYSDFEKEHDEYAQSLEASVNSYAVKRFKLKDLDYSQYSQLVNYMNSANAQ